MKLTNFKNKHCQSKFTQPGHSRQVRFNGWNLSGDSMDASPEKKKLTVRKKMGFFLYANVCRCLLQYMYKSMNNGLAQIHVFKDFTCIVHISIYHYHFFPRTDDSELSSLIYKLV